MVLERNGKFEFWRQNQLRIHVKNISWIFKRTNWLCLEEKSKTPTRKRGQHKKSVSLDILCYSSSRKKILDLFTRSLELKKGVGSFFKWHHHRHRNVNKKKSIVFLNLSTLFTLYVNVIFLKQIPRKRKNEWNTKTAQYLKIAEKVSFNIFEKPKTCGRKVLPDRSILTGQKLLEIFKIRWFKWDIFGLFSNTVNR